MGEAASAVPREAAWADYVRRCAGRDESALEALYDESSQLTYTIAMRILQDEADASEVVLGVYKQIWDSAGDPNGGLRVLEKREELLRSGDAPGRVARFWSWFLRVSIGYGYYPGRAIWLIVFLSLLGWIVYGTSYGAGTMIPTDKDAFNAFNDKDPLPAYYPAFSPLV
jgi:hypothetical protein